MKKVVDAVIVVEGQSDVAFLEHFISADFVITNGSEIAKETIQYLQTISQKRDIIVLTDPDYPGLRIRSIIAEHIPSVMHAYIRKEVSIKHHKVGVAESTEEEILNAISLCIDKKIKDKPLSDLVLSDLYDLHYMGYQESAKKRKLLADKLQIGYSGNAKRLLKKLQSLGISKNDLRKMGENDDC